jgi:hypothetical protein
MHVGCFAFVQRETERKGRWHPEGKYFKKSEKPDNFQERGFKPNVFEYYMRKANSITAFCERNAQNLVNILMILFLANSRILFPCSPF